MTTPRSTTTAKWTWRKEADFVATVTLPDHGDRPIRLVVSDRSPCLHYRGRGYAKAASGAGKEMLRGSIGLTEAELRDASQGAARRVRVEAALRERLDGSRRKQLGGAVGVASAEARRDEGVSLGALLDAFRTDRFGATGENVVPKESRERGPRLVTTRRARQLDQTMRSLIAVYGRTAPATILGTPDGARAWITYILGGVELAMPASRGTGEFHLSERTETEPFQFTRGETTSGVHAILDCVRAIFAYMTGAGRPLPVNPLEWMSRPEDRNKAGIPAKTSHQPQVDPRDYEAMLAVADPVERLLLKLAYFSGRRISQLALMRQKDVLRSPEEVRRATAAITRNAKEARDTANTYRAGALFLDGKNTKATKGVYAPSFVMPLTADLRAELDAYLATVPANPTGILFPNSLGNPFGETQQNDMFNDLSDRAGCVAIEGLAWHGFRHLLASEATAAGVPVKVLNLWAGWSDDIREHGHQLHYAQVTARTLLAFAHLDRGAAAASDVAIPLSAEARKKLESLQAA